MVKLFFSIFIDMRDITIIDDSFDLNVTSSYHLSIIAHTRGFSFAVMDAVRMKFMVFKNNWFGDALKGDQFYDKIETIIAVDGYLNHNYKKISFCLANPQATLIPEPMFQVSDKDSFRPYLGEISDDDILIERFIPSLDSYILFSLPSRIYNQALNILDGPQFYHQSHPLIENALSGSKAKTGKSVVYVNIFNEFMDAVVIDDGQLKLYNSFPYKTDKDLVFYILYLYDQFKLLSENTRLEIAGLINENSELVSLLKRHIRHIQFQEFNRSFSYSYTFNELSQHHFSNLINLFRCE